MQLFELVLKYVIFYFSLNKQRKLDVQYVIVGHKKRLSQTIETKNTLGVS